MPVKRSEMQQIAAAIVESVRVNEKMPLPGLKAVAIQYTGVFFDAVEVEAFVFKLAQEICATITSRDTAIARAEAAERECERLRGLLTEAADYIEADTDPEEEHPEAARLRSAAGVERE